MKDDVVYIVGSGDGEDGDPWTILGVFAHEKAAEAARASAGADWVREVTMNVLWGEEFGNG